MPILWPALQDHLPEGDSYHTQLRIQNQYATTVLCFRLSRKCLCWAWQRRVLSMVVDLWLQSMTSVRYTFAPYMAVKSSLLRTVWRSSVSRLVELSSISTYVLFYWLVKYDVEPVNFLLSLMGWLIKPSFSPTTAFAITKLLAVATVCIWPLNHSVQNFKSSSGWKFWR